MYKMKLLNVVKTVTTKEASEALEEKGYKCIGSDEDAADEGGADKPDGGKPAKGKPAAKPGA